MKTPRPASNPRPTHYLISVLLLLLAAFLLGACHSQPSDLASKVRSKPEYQLSFYDDLRQKPVTKRHAMVSDAILKRLQDYDSMPEYEPYFPSQEEQALFAEYYKLLPKAFQSVMEEKLVAIYWIRNFKGGGMADVLFDSQGELLSVMYLNSRILRRDIGQWINYRDNSSFSLGDSGVSIMSAVNLDKKCLLLTLCHEAAHIFDNYRHVTPYTEPFLRSSDVPVPTPFIQGIWQDFYQALTECAVITDPNFSTYGLGKTLGADQAVTYYKKLAASPFSSLYGAQNWAEDFAETATWHFLDKKMGIHYTITISQPGQKDLVITPQENPAVKVRLGLIDAIIGE